MRAAQRLGKRFIVLVDNVVDVLIAGQAWDAIVVATINNQKLGVKITKHTKITKGIKHED